MSDPNDKRHRKKNKRITFFVASLGVIAAFAAITVAVLGSPSPSSPPTATPPATTAPRAEPDAKELEAFLADCEKNINKWQMGQVDYPGRMSVDMGDSAAYVVAVDIRNKPVTAEKVIPAEDPESAPVAVQCLLGARLVPVGEALTVDESDWIVREFTPTGFLNWSWAVKALAPGDHDLVLELRPTLEDLDGYTLVGGNSPPNTTTFVSRVHVHASWIQHAGQWWDENWGTVLLISGAIGVALPALIKWGGDVSLALRDSLAKWRGE